MPGFPLMHAGSPISPNAQTVPVIQWSDGGPTLFEWVAYICSERQDLYIAG